MASDIAMQLSTGRFSSKMVVEVDSIITQSIFATIQSQFRDCDRAANMKTLAVDFNLEEEQTKKIQDAYKNFGERKRLNLKSAEYLSSADSLALHVQAVCTRLQQLGEEGRPCISWCLASYLMLINPGASVKLSAVDVGSKRRFGIRAAREIKKNDIIHELIGLMPMDNETPHTRISEITPSSGQNQPTDALRILFGPMRFVNHLCSNSNASYAAENNTSAFFVYALRDIASGEEVTVDYGQLYSQAGCTCASCSGSLESEDAVERTEGQRKRKRRDSSDSEELVRAQLDDQDDTIDSEKELDLQPPSVTPEKQDSLEHTIHSAQSQPPKDVIFKTETPTSTRPILHKHAQASSSANSGTAQQQRTPAPSKRTVSPLSSSSPASSDRFMSSSPSATRQESEEPEEDLPYKLPPGPYSTNKPEGPYAALVGQAILSAPDHQLSTSEIYEWIATVYPHYKLGNRRETTWMNGVRSTLSVTAVFRKVPSNRPTSKTAWTIHDEDVDCFKDGGYRRELCKDYETGYTARVRKRRKVGDKINDPKVKNAKRGAPRIRFID